MNCSTLRANTGYSVRTLEFQDQEYLENVRTTVYRNYTQYTETRISVIRIQNLPVL